MSDLALPPHLRGRKHNDWPWPFKGVSRGWNAAGPRAPEKQPDYLPWPPKLVAGKGVARWETAGGDSIIFVPELQTATVRESDVYDRIWSAIEMNPGKPDFLKKFPVYLGRRIRTIVYDVPRGDGKWAQACEPDQYSPSALQKFSRTGWMKLDPAYKSQWWRNNQKELGWLIGGARGKAPEDSVIFYRGGARPDHVDLYYNTDRLVPIGFGGFKWE